MEHKLPDLPYEMNALQPHIDSPVWLRLTHLTLCSSKLGRIK